jgi:uncharacterized protein YndB with AHSA1/START domain
MSFPFQLDRIVTIVAPRDVVFSFFTDSARWATWWGAGSTIDPKRGGRVYIRLPGNVEVSGEVLEIQAPAHLVFTYGYASGTPFAAGGSRVTIKLEDVPSGTRLHLTHEFPDAASRDHHVQGWRFQLSLFSNVVADEVNAGAEDLVDAWFRAWSESDAGLRERAFAQIASRNVSFRDRFSLLDGLDDLVAHTGAAQRFMPGVTLQRNGDVRHCQGTVLADWIWRMANGDERARGTNVFQFGADGKIDAVIGIASGGGAHRN